jgi:hypothetical protein
VIAIDLDYLGVFDRGGDIAASLSNRLESKTFIWYHAPQQERLPQSLDQLIHLYQLPSRGFAKSYNRNACEL